MRGKSFTPAAGAAAAVFFLVSCSTIKIEVYEKPIVLEAAVPAAEPVETRYLLTVNTESGSSSISHNENSLGSTPLSVMLPAGEYTFTMSRENHADNLFHVNLDRDRNVNLVHRKNPVPFPQIGVYQTGSKPKQVLFTPDDKQIVITLLDGEGFDVLSIDDLIVVKTVKAPQSREKGYAEGLFIPEHSSFFISQMSTGNIHEFEYPSYRYKSSIGTGGIWPKFLAWNNCKQIIAVSNWSSDTVSLISFDDKSIAAAIAAPGSPRGLVFSADSSYLYTAGFDSGVIQKISTQDWKETGRFSINSAAMRHLLLTPDNSYLIASNMYHGKIHLIDTLTMKETDSFKVFSNPNTMDITHDGRYLFVSSRGPNNPESYLKRSLVNGRITVIDLVLKKIIHEFEGGNQPTGLDISNDNTMLCFSNFQDNTIELYRISAVP